MPFCLPFLEILLYFSFLIFEMQNKIGVGGFKLELNRLFFLPIKFVISGSELVEIDTLLARFQNETKFNPAECQNRKYQLDTCYLNHVINLHFLQNLTHGVALEEVFRSL